MHKETIVVWFSCGAASAVAAIKTLEIYGATHNVRIVNNPVKEEDPDNLRFLRDVESLLGVPIERAVNPAYPSCSAVEVWDSRKYMSGVAGAPCTGELKKKARQLWERENHADHHVVGFTVDERGRHERFVLTERPLLPVLIDLGLTKQDCFRICLEMGLALPITYSEGMPNANCVGCVKVTSPTYWNLIRRIRPAIFQERLLQSRRLGVRLVECHPRWLPFCGVVNGEWHDLRSGECLHKTGNGGKRRLKIPRIFLDELPPEAVGAPLKAMTIDCGIFCEEKLEIHDADIN